MRRGFRKRPRLGFGFRLRPTVRMTKRFDDVVPRRGKCHGVNHCIGDSKFGDDVLQFRVAPVVAVLADQEDGSAVLCPPALENADGEVDGVDGPWFGRRSRKPSISRVHIEQPRSCSKNYSAGRAPHRNS